MRMVIAGGGTGGHLFPALALAEEVTGRGGEVLLMGSGRKIEQIALEKTPYQVKPLPVEGVFGRSIPGKFRALGKMIWATFVSTRAIKRFAPQLVFGVGGYASVPTLLAAKLLGIKSALHEQNTIPGRANLFLARLVDRIFVTFPETRRYFPKEKTIVSGMPIRKGLRRGRREHEGIGLLVTGGSQGARTINEAVLEISPALFQAVPELFLVHQTGSADYERVKKAYQERSLKAIVLPFIKDMAWAYAQADVVLARAGAATVAELCYLKKPAILIPYPYAVADHQRENARFLVKAKGALMFLENELTPAKLLKALTELLTDADRRRAMSQKLSGLLPENALSIIYKEMEALAAYA